MRILLALSAAALVAAKPANDWNKPCFHGECAYDLPEGSSASGTLKISGPATAITDITDAAGWIVLSCDPHELVQDIRVVCKSTDERAAGCDHLFQGAGPVNKLVRLPESCGAGPFVRISNARTDVDQHIPNTVRRRIVQRDDQLPTVRTLSVDANFDAVDPSIHGPVSFVLTGANVPGADVNFEFSPEDLQSREDDFKVPGFLKKIGHAVHKAVDAGKKRLFIRLPKPYKAKISKIDVHKEAKLPRININKDFHLIDQHLSCGPVQGSLKVDVHGEAHAAASVGIVAVGQLIPPKIDKFGAFATLDADLGGSVHLAAALTGDLDSGQKTLFQQGIPGFSIPGIFTLGPFIELDAQVKAHVDLRLDLTVGLHFKVDKAQLYFPPSAGKSGGSFRIEKTPLKLAASPSVTAKGKIEGHIIPKLVLGLSGLGGKIKADVHLGLDTSASLNIEASNAKREIHALDSTTPPQMVDRTIPPYGSHARGLAARAPDAQFGGCVDIEIGIDVYGMGEGHILGIFDKHLKIDIYNKRWHVLKKCFGRHKRSISPLRGRSSLEVSGTQLSCPARGMAPPVSITNGVVDTKSMQPT